MNTRHEPLVSIVINNFNYAAFLRESIESALAQTWGRLEVVVVDDGSTDGSKAVIESYGSRIIPLLKSNGGQGSAYNAGFGLSKGAWVLFLDSDDKLAPNTIEACLEEQTDGVSNIQFFLEIINHDGQPTGLLHPSQKMHDGDVVPFLRRFRYYCSPPSSGNIYNRRFLQQVFPMPETEWKISADAYLILAAPLYGQIRSRPSVLGYYRRHGGSASDHSSSDLAFVNYLKKEHQKEQHRQRYVSKLLASHDYYEPVSGYVSPPNMTKLRVALVAFTPLPLKAVRLCAYLRLTWRTASSWPNYNIARRLLFNAWCFAVLFLPKTFSRRLIVSTFLPHERVRMQRLWQWHGGAK